MPVLLKDDENGNRHPRAGELSWLLDAGIITAAAVGVLLFTLDAREVLNWSRPQAGVIETPNVDPDSVSKTTPSLWRVQTHVAQLFLYAVPQTVSRDANWTDISLFEAFDGARAVLIDANTEPSVASRFTERARQLKIAVTPIASGLDLIPQVERQLKLEGTTFVALDPARLGGPDGLVVRLRHDGQIVTRLDPKKY